MKNKKKFSTFILGLRFRYVNYWQVRKYASYNQDECKYWKAKAAAICNVTQVRILKVLR